MTWCYPGSANATPPKAWPVVGLCGGKQKYGRFFSESGEMDPTVLVQFQPNARKVLQRMEIICYSRPELLKDKVFGAPENLYLWGEVLSCFWTQFTWPWVLPQYPECPVA